MIDLSAIKLEIKELRNDITDDNFGYLNLMYCVDKRLMEAWLACFPQEMVDNEGFIEHYVPEYKQITRELYNSIIEIDDVIHQLNTFRNRLLTLIEELRDTNKVDSSWRL